MEILNWYFPQLVGWTFSMPSNHFLFKAHLILGKRKDFAKCAGALSCSISQLFIWKCSSLARHIWAKRPLHYQELIFLLCKSFSRIALSIYLPTPSSIARSCVVICLSWATISQLSPHLNFWISPITHIMSHTLLIRYRFAFFIKFWKTLEQSVHSQDIHNWKHSALLWHFYSLCFKI